MTASAVIEDALSSLRIAGNVLLRESYLAPWSIAVPAASELSGLLGMDPRSTLAAFHLVEYGQCEIALDRRQRHHLQAGEMLVCFGGSAHEISQGNAGRPRPIASLLAGRSGRARAQPQRSGESTALLCGVFELHDTAANPMFAALPRAMRVPLSRPGDMHNLAGVARLMAEEIDRGAPGAVYVVSRLLEVLCAQAIRSWIESAPADEAGWFRAIRDPVVGRAVAAIHAEPSLDWTVASLAGRVAISPSRFAARFSETMGESPMGYVTRWRMTVARRHLRGTQWGIEQIAQAIGYESPAAFSRSFRRLVGMPPASWRAREAGLAPPGRETSVDRETATARKRAPVPPTRPNQEGVGRTVRTTVK